jgi:hypothetical protein
VDKRSYHTKEGFQVSERGIDKGARGRKEQGDCAMYIVNLYIKTLPGRPRWLYFSKLLAVTIAIICMVIEALRYFIVW